MKRSQSHIERLDNVLSGIENLVLAATDDELLRESMDADATDDVKAVVAEQLIRHRVVATAAARRSTASRKRAPRGTKEWSQRLAYVQSLLASRPDLSPRLGAVFGTGKTPTSEEVNEVVDELIKLGLMPVPADPKK